MSDLKRMKELVSKLSEAAKAYYQEDKEIISNFEYDQLYDELVELEKKTDVILSGSPTQQVGYELLSELPKERHSERMLSLDKTKEREKLQSWLGDNDGLLSWKLDGLTIVLTYEDGVLTKGITRGNGEIGEVITNNVKVFDNVPLKINNKGITIIRGEAVIKYSDFESINAVLEEGEKYKNPRNLCSGTVRQLNNEITAKRHVNFFAFQLIQSGEFEADSKYEQLKWLGEQGFEVVETKKVTESNIVDMVEVFSKAIETNDFASDGLVLTFDSIAYSNSLGATSKFPKHSIAFKWQDEIQETELVEIEWSASRTGLINPVAIFEPVELEGTTVSRASLHNLSIVEELALGLGDRVTVYKANMIIPQIAENLTRSNNLVIPTTCPVCGEDTEIKEVNDIKVLVCNNELCTAKRVKGFAHFASRDAMNIDGMSEATIEKFIAQGLLHKLSDLYDLEQYKETIETMEGFGEKSFTRLMKSLEQSKTVRMENFIYALGILNVGLSNARLLCKHFNYNFDAIITAKEDELVEIEGYGEVIAKSICDYFSNEERREEIDRLRSIVTFEQVETNTTNLIFEGKVFVITGSLEHYENRKLLKEEIELLGGKVSGSVSGKTNYLINNDTESTSGKNKKAKELNIPVISEAEYISLKDNQ